LVVHGRSILSSGLIGVFVVLLAPGLFIILQPPATGGAGNTSTFQGSGTFVENPTQADVFVDSVGVNTHFDYPKLPYNLNFSAVESLLLQSGIRHLRDGGDQWGYAGSRFGNQYAKLAADGFTLEVTSPHINTNTDIQKNIAFIPNAMFIEGDNEADCSDGSSWVGVITSQYQNLYAQVKASVRPNLTVVGPSMCRTADALRVPSLSAYMDVASAHWSPPGLSGNPEMITSCCNGDIPTILADFSGMSGGKPLWITELGYQDGLANKSCNGGSYYDALTSSKYAPRTLANNWNYGIRRTFFYEFIDGGTAEGCAGNFGMVFHNYTPKPYYNAVKGMIRLLSDKGTSFTPKQFSWTLSGATPSVDHLTVQKRNGENWIMIWNAVSSWTNYVDVTNPPVTTTVSFANQHSVVKIYTQNVDGTLSAAQPQTLSGNSFKLAVQDTITYVQVLPSGPTPRG
jgi:hypothetical protein